MVVNVLVVDDDEEILNALEKILKEYDVKILKAYSFKEALFYLEEEDIDAIISDMILPDGNGIEILKRIREEGQLKPFILLTAHSTVNSAVEALKLGANDYITKPFKVVELKKNIENLIKGLLIEKENLALKEEVVRLKGYDEVVGHSKAMKEIFSMIERIKDIDATVLITGESGTGKEVLARLIHRRSKRANAPFVGINCGAIPETLIEDELFGHVKGAFTDAIAPRVGAFERANGGVLFLDEIGTLRLDLQVKLLRVLQEREFTPIGSTSTKKVDVRIIAATNSNLKEMVKEGKFREDLYYRLNIINIEIPPLRERKEDIIPLLRFMVKKVANRLNMKEKDFSKEALNALLNYNYPGNVRELENIVERAMALSSSDYIDISDLPKEVIESADRVFSGEVRKIKSALFFVENMGLDEYLKKFEKKIIMEALEKCKWRKTKAANLLKIKRTTLIERMKRLEIPLKRK